MKKILLAAGLLTLPMLALAVDLKGAKIVAQDGQSLGVVGDRLQTESVLNPFGIYGDSHNEKSIWNTFGKYGSQFDETSAFNPYANHPPKIYLRDGGKPYFLTTNTYLTPRIDPNTLRSSDP
jgi:hypothetical protein